MCIFCRKISSFLDRPDIRKTLGVDPSLTANFSSCSSEVGYNFDKAMDMIFPTELYIGALLERGVRVLIYVGENDWICNWVRLLFLFHSEDELLILNLAVCRSETSK